MEITQYDEVVSKGKVAKEILKTGCLLSKEKAFILCHCSARWPSLVWLWFCQLINSDLICSVWMTVGPSTSIVSLCFESIFFTQSEMYSLKHILSLWQDFISFTPGWSLWHCFESGLLCSFITSSSWTSLLSNNSILVRPVSRGYQRRLQNTNPQDTITAEAKCGLKSTSKLIWTP